MADSEKNRELYSLHFLRCIAVILITWDHLLPGMYLENTGGIPITPVERYILWPLSIINYFGFYGVVIFFLISGYAGLLAYDRKRASIGGFCLKRIFRIFPPAFFSLIVYYVVYYLVHRLFLHGQLMTVPIPYLQANGALWTLKIEIIFYILFAALIPVFKKSLPLGTLAGIVLTVIGCELGARRSELFELAKAVSYCFYILIGAAIYLVREYRFRSKYGKLLCYALFPVLWFCVVHYNIVIFEPERYEPGNSYGVSFLYALLTFLVFVSNEERLPRWSSAKVISRYSYPVYLNQVPMRAVFAPLYSVGMPTPLLSVITFGLTVFFSWIYDRFVDSRFSWLYKKTVSLGGRKA